MLALAAPDLDHGPRTEKSATHVDVRGQAAVRPMDD